MTAPKTQREILTTGKLKETIDRLPPNTPIYVGECGYCTKYVIGFQEPVMCKGCNEPVSVRPIIVG